MGNLYAKALASLYRTAADGAFNALLRAEPGFPAAVAALANIKIETLVVAADPALDAALGPEAAEHVTSLLPHGRLVTIPGARHAVHASKPRALYKMFPQSIEVQLLSGNAGDFWVIREDIKVKDMETRRPGAAGEKWGSTEGDARRILNLTDNSEKPLGQWNSRIVEVRGRSITVWVNGDLVNDGFDATVDQGRIALQAEGAEVEFRKVDIGPLPPAAK